MFTHEVVEQTVFSSFDKRLAAFLIEQSTLSGSDAMDITHEEIANHLGTAREVVTRMLRYFKSPAPVREISLVTLKTFTKTRLIHILNQTIIENLPAQMKQKKKVYLEVVGAPTDFGQEYP